jgi:hypothetical protein
MRETAIIAAAGFLGFHYDGSRATRSFPRAVTARRFPPTWSIRHLARGLLIALTFPGLLIWDLGKYCNSQEGRLGKIGMFVALSPIFGFSALVWFGLWALTVGLLWVAVQGA